MKKLIDKISFTGVYCIPISIYLAIKFFNIVSPRIMQNPHKSLTVWFLGGFIGCLLALDIYSHNVTAKLNGKTSFSPPDGFNMLGGCHDPEYTSTRYKYLTPKVPEHLLHRKPIAGSLILGKYHGKYVCTPSLNIQGKHLFVFGGSGTGKSSTMLIPDLLLNLRGSDNESKLDGYATTSSIIVDIKGELSQKSTKPGDPSVLIFDPSDRSSIGYDPFFYINEESSLEDVFKTMELIAISLIPISPMEKDAFWKKKARQLLSGLLTYEFDSGKLTFIECIDAILSNPIKTTLLTIQNTKTSDKVYYRTLCDFFDLAEETMSGITSNMTEHIQIFTSDSNVKYALCDNPLKFSPKTLDAEMPYEIFLRIKESDLTRYHDILMLILNQSFSFFEDRNFEGSSNPRGILFIIDELSRVCSAGPIDRLGDVLRTGRSRGISCLLLSQSWEGLTRAYTDDEITDILQNCSYVCSLDASPKTARYIINAAGKYPERTINRSGYGRHERVSYSYTDKDILIPADLTNLKTNNKSIIISKDDGGFFKLSKVPYYKDPFFLKNKNN